MEAEINFRIRSLPQTELRSIVEECGAYEAVSLTLIDFIRLLGALRREEAAPSFFLEARLFTIYRSRRCSIYA